MDDDMIAELVTTAGALGLLITGTPDDDAAGALQAAHEWLLTDLMPRLGADIAKLIADAAITAAWRHRAELESAANNHFAEC